MSRSSEPIFNIPTVVSTMIGIFVLIWAGEEYLAYRIGGHRVFVLFCIHSGPLRWHLFADEGFPGGIGADIWTFVTYAFLHGSLAHVGLNSVWFLPFGSAVARRFGTLRFVGFFLATAIAGALVHLATHYGEVFPMIGASAAISGFMAGAMRFAFQRGGPLAMFQTGDLSAYQVPAEPLKVALTDTRVLVFLFAWFGLNLLFGIGPLNLFGGEQSIAWEAHIGGFVAGLLLFSWFDPVPLQTA